ncbi:hypothetical protein HF325_001147 [Metschnikowia pulcherrima]|uniref:Uncharacterized protein n=1 Tax=Metschnikowia pulcherrima TaxID=27326 RepID=A0A8H7GU14_9ASCO|nr:hypothetical protein HF325_001147 [Metschnikowia pulcherrima]
MISSFAIFFLFLSTYAFSSFNDKRDLKVIKITKTVDNTITNTHVVDAPTSTIVDWSTLTTTSTTTRYTSTYTSTIFGQAYEYLSVYSSVVAVVENEGTTEVIGPAQTERSSEMDKTTDPETGTTTSTTPAVVVSIPESVTPETSEAPTTSEALGVSTEAAETLETETKPTSTQAATDAASGSSRSFPVIAPSSQTKTVVSSTSAAETAISTEPAAPETTATSSYEELQTYDSQITAFPSTLDGYTLGETLRSVVSGLICVIDYAYYSQGFTETITSTTLIYHTITI